MADIRKARAYAAELAGSFPTQVNRDLLTAYASAFMDIGLDIADDVSSLLRVRSDFPPSIAQIYAAAREVRKETMSGDWSSWDCVFIDGVVCPQCHEIHGHLLEPHIVAHGIYHAKRYIAGETEDRPGMLDPGGCDCGYVAEAAL